MSDDEVAPSEPTNSGPAGGGIRARDVILWLLPILVGIFGVIGGFLYSTAQKDRFEHLVVLVSANDGRIGLRDNRDLAFEEAQALLAEREQNALVATFENDEDIDVSFNSRFNASLDIFVEADTRAGAQAAAESLAAAVVDTMITRSQERFVDSIAADAASVAELDAEIERIDTDIAATAATDATALTRLERERAATVDSRVQLERQIIAAENGLASATDPVRIAQSTSRGQSAPERRKTAGLAGAAAAMAALLLVAVIPRRET